MKMHRRRASRGQILVIFGVAAVALFAVVSLAIDGGRVLMDQRTLQNAADGAALTAAADLGPGADAVTSGTAEDDAVYSLERALGLDFSNNYTCPGPSWCAVGQVGTVGHRLQGGPCAPWACVPFQGTTHGPWNASTAGSNPCCLNWNDTTGQYTLTLRTPFAYGGTTEPEAFIRVHFRHQMPLLIGGSIWPTVQVSTSTVARNYAIPYSIFMFKWYEDHDLTTNGITSVSVTKRIGDNGSSTFTGANALTFVCAPSPAYGGDLYEWHPVSSGNIAATSIRENTCGAPVSPSQDLSLGAAWPILPPTLHLPPDPSTLGISCSGLQSYTVNTNYVVLHPTGPLDPTYNNCTRYSLVNVQNNGVVYLDPGTYYFEDDSSGKGVADNGYLVTGDCYPVATNFPACDPSVAVANGICNTVLTGFHCTADRDFGVLLVFWPAGYDINCTNGTNNGQSFCKLGNSSGSNNALGVSGSGNIHITSTPKFHNVGVWVDQNHDRSSWNFTNSGTLPASCNTVACSYHIGNGSHVVTVGGNGVIAINGAIFAPDDNLTLSGGAAGSGYGQLLGYTLTMNGGVPVNERYNPLALAYSPVIVQ